MVNLRLNSLSSILTLSAIAQPHGPELSVHNKTDSKRGQSPTQLSPEVNICCFLYTVSCGSVTAHLSGKCLLDVNRAEGFVQRQWPKVICTYKQTSFPYLIDVRVTSVTTQYTFIICTRQFVLTNMYTYFVLNK